MTILRTIGGHCLSHGNGLLKSKSEESSEERRSIQAIMVNTEVTDGRELGVEPGTKVVNIDKPYLLPISATHSMPVFQDCSLFKFY